MEEEIDGGQRRRGGGCKRDKRSGMDLVHGAADISRQKWRFSLNAMRALGTKRTK